MEVFRVKSMPNEYQAVWYQAQDRQIFEMLTSGKSIAHLWKTPKLIIEDPEATLELPDFPGLEFHFLIASESAWNVVRPLLEGAVEALSVIHPSGKPYVVLNVIQVLDCLLLEGCRTNQLPNDPDTYFSKVYTYAFDEEKLRDKHLFRCPQMKAFEVYTSLQFKQLVEENKLTGLKFIKIYPSPK